MTLSIIMTTTNSIANENLKKKSLAIPDIRLRYIDSVMYKLVEKEKHRQMNGLELIASENFTSSAVMETLGSCLTNKYSEGQPGKRYYGGNSYIDMIESLCKDRALDAFNLDKTTWDVNVQLLSGSPANFAVYTALLKPHDRIMGLELSHGGHLTHGYYTPKKKISATSIFFESMPYHLDVKTGFIDYDELEKNAKIFRPKLIIAGASAYPRNYDYKRMRDVCDRVGAYLMTDMAHISGLVAANIVESPFIYSDVVTTTTHKSLRGPRGGMIFYKKCFKKQIDSAVFPGLQGGPHNNNIGALAVCLKEVKTKEFIHYQNQIVKNCKILASALISKGYTLISNGSDNHLILVDVTPFGINGAMLEKVLDMSDITVNKNAIIGDKKAIVPGGIRIGTPALTTRGFLEEDFEYVAELIDRGVKITIDASKGCDKFDDFVSRLETASDITNQITDLKSDVNNFVSIFPMPGI